MRLENKVAIVTGGGGSIGREIALELAREGAIVTVVDLDQAKAESTLMMIKVSGGRGKALTVNVTSKQETIRMADLVNKEFKSIDILVNCAGTDIKGSIIDLPESTWDFLMNLNLKGVFLCTQAVAGIMVAKQSGRIINISSIAGKTGEPFTSPYCATKFGVIGFTQSVAMELGKDGITVNAVCPGPVESDLIKKSIEQSAKLNKKTYEQELYDKFLSSTPIGRMAKPGDIAKAVVFLASDDAAFITGSTINVSGGKEVH